MAVGFDAREHGVMVEQGLHVVHPSIVLLVLDPAGGGCAWSYGHVCCCCCCCFCYCYRCRPSADRCHAGDVDITTTCVCVSLGDSGVVVA